MATDIKNSMVMSRILNIDLFLFVQCTLAENHRVSPDKETSIVAALNVYAGFRMIVQRDSL